MKQTKRGILQVVEVVMEESSIAMCPKGHAYLTGEITSPCPDCKGGQNNESEDPEQDSGGSRQAIQSFKKKTLPLR